MFKTCSRSLTSGVLLLWEPSGLDAYVFRSFSFMSLDTSQSCERSIFSVSAAKAASRSRRCICRTAPASLPCSESPTAFTRHALQRSRRRACNSSSASWSPRPQLSRAESMRSLFPSKVSSGSSSPAATSTRKSDRSCGRVSSRSFSSTRSHLATSACRSRTSAGETACLFSNRRTLLWSIVLFAVWTMVFVTSSPMPKNLGAQFVRVSTSALLSSPWS
mmetsp:Transcript_126211/g.338645  ORF Transcript_126211/g.338645 Transcript_126211/m.338645 type:complete len:219 (-) Transcript_126211:1298-1954(-)